MYRIFGMVGLILISYQAISQNTFPKDSTIWTFEHTSFNLPPLGSHYSTIETFGAFGDTLLNGNNYRKIYLDTLSADSVFSFTNAIISGFMRSNSNKVFFLDTLLKEHLIMDFGLQVGDTFQILNTKIVVSKKDQVFIGGKMRVRMFLDPGFRLGELVWIEGIGYLEGQGVWNNWQYFNVGLNKSFELLCASVNEQLVYAQIGGLCEIDLNHPPKIEPHDTSIYFNPFDTIHFCYRVSDIDLPDDSLSSIRFLATDSVFDITLSSDYCIQLSVHSKFTMDTLFSIVCDSSNSCDTARLIVNPSNVNGLGAIGSKNRYPIYLKGSSLHLNLENRYAHLNIYDLLGRSKLHVRHQTGNISLPTDEFKNGIYILEIRWDQKSQEKSVVQKFLINR